MSLWELRTGLWLMLGDMAGWPEEASVAVGGQRGQALVGTLWLPWVNGKPPVDDGAGEGQDLSGICSELSPSDTAHSIFLRKPGSGQKEGRWTCLGAGGTVPRRGIKSSR